MKKYTTIIKRSIVLIVLLFANIAQVAQNFDIGQKAYSSLKWQQIADVFSGHRTYDFSIPIANEQLDICNTSKIIVANVPPSTPGVGSIDYSKTQISPAPVTGITVSGSGMTAANGVNAITILKQIFKPSIYR